MKPSHTARRHVTIAYGIICMWLMLCCTACGPGLLEGELDTETDENAIESLLVLQGNAPYDTDVELQLCPTQQEVSCHNEYISNYPFSAILTAAGVDNNARFSHFNRDLILGYIDDGDISHPFAIQTSFEDALYNDITQNDSDIKFFAADDAPSLKWLGAVTSTRGVFQDEYQHLAAAVDEDGYFLVSIPHSSEDTLLKRVENSTLQTDAELTHLVYLQAKTLADFPELNQLCLYGEGMFCFDGNTWNMEISPDADFVIRSIGVASITNQPMILAVGDPNAILFKYNDRWASTSLPQTDAPLVQISINTLSQFFTAAGDRFLLHGAIDRSIERCEVAPHILRFNYFINSTLYVILAQDGWLWSGSLDYFSRGTLCKTQHRIEGAVDGFPLNDNYYVLHPNALWVGDNFSQTVAE